MNQAQMQDATDQARKKEKRAAYLSAWPCGPS